MLASPSVIVIVIMTIVTIVIIVTVILAITIIMITRHYPLNNHFVMSLTSPGQSRERAVGSSALECF